MKALCWFGKDAVGLEAHGTGSIGALYDRARTAMFLATDRAEALRQCINACRKGGTVSVPGVYGGYLDKIPFGAAFAKGLTFKMGQTHVQKYLRPLLERVERGDIDPSFVITHRMRLADAPEGLRHLQAQAGRVHQGRAEAITGRARRRHRAFRVPAPNC
jgi:threonine dehydrogenase-like Zn-dependent dehydrogenase